MTEKLDKPTPTRTAVEKFTPEEGVKIFGSLGWLHCLLKSQQPHDSSRREKRLKKSEKARQKKTFKSEEEL